MPPEFHLPGDLSVHEYSFSSVLYNQRINHLHRQYEDDRNEIYRKATRDITEIVNSATFDQEHLKSIIFRMEESFAENSAATNSQHLFKTDELRNNVSAWKPAHQESHTLS